MEDEVIDISGMSLVDDDDRLDDEFVARMQRKLDITGKS